MRCPARQLAAAALVLLLLLLACRVGVADSALRRAVPIEPSLLVVPRKTADVPTCSTLEAVQAAATEADDIPHVHFQLGVPRTGTSLQFALVCAALAAKVADDPDARVWCGFGPSLWKLLQYSQRNASRDFLVIKSHVLHTDSQWRLAAWLRNATAVATAVEKKHVPATPRVLTLSSAKAAGQEQQQQRRRRRQQMQPKACRGDSATAAAAAFRAPGWVWQTSSGRSSVVSTEKSLRRGYPYSQLPRVLRVDLQAVRASDSATRAAAAEYAALLRIGPREAGLVYDWLEQWDVLRVCCGVQTEIAKQ